MGPFRFCVALLHLYTTFHYNMGPFHLRETLSLPAALNMFTDLLNLPWKTLLK